MADIIDRKSVLTSENPFWIWVDVITILLNPEGLSDQAFFGFSRWVEYYSQHTRIFSELYQKVYPHLPYQPNFLGMLSPKYPSCFYLAVVIRTSSTQHWTMLKGMRCYIMAYRHRSSIQAATNSVAGDVFLFVTICYLYDLSVTKSHCSCASIDGTPVSLRNNTLFIFAAQKAYSSHVILPPIPRSSKWSLSFQIAHPNPVGLSVLPKRATLPVQPILLGLITPMLVAEV